MIRGFQARLCRVQARMDSEERAVPNPTARSVLEFYENFVSQQRDSAENDEKERLSILSSAFHQLTGFLLQVQRIGEEAQKLPYAHI